MGLTVVSHVLCLDFSLCVTCSVLHMCSIVNISNNPSSTVVWCVFEWWYFLELGMTYKCASVECV